MSTPIGSSPFATRAARGLTRASPEIGVERHRRLLRRIETRVQVLQQDGVELRDRLGVAVVALHQLLAGTPPFAAQFAEVLVDTETGQVTVEQLVMAVDSGTIVNPITASGQVEGGMTQALGYAVCEEMVYDEQGALLTTNLSDYRIYSAVDMPEMQSYLVETHDPFGPFGVKAIAEIPIDGMAPAVANAVADAVGVRVRQIPLTPERVFRAINAQTETAK